MGKINLENAYILLKDHKANFINKHQARLINPTKTELGKISKQIIQKIITEVQGKAYQNLWKNSFEAIEW